MKAIAPGKLVLTGAYAVLDGAPAIVAAVDRYAIADTAGVAPSPSVEVRAAFGDRAAPSVDVRAMHDDRGRKLGLGSSAAALVASLAASAMEAGDDVAHPAVRDRVFRCAREAHARAQGGGSGIDVAASVYGGLVRYRLRTEGPEIEPVGWPEGVVMAAFFTGESARTSDLLARVASLRARSPVDSARLSAAMLAAALRATSAVCEGAAAFVDSARSYGRLLRELGDRADAPIVPRSCVELARLAEAEDAAFYPSGAGGGDVAVWLGPSTPSAHFAAQATALGFSQLPLHVDRGGVRRAPPFTQRD